MKRCPECRRDYYDDTLLYCLDDGNALLEGPAFVGASSDEAATAILSESGAVATGFRGDEGQTAAHINTTDQTAILHTGAEAKPRESLGDLSERQSHSAHRAAKPQGKVGSRQRLLAVLAIIVVLLVGGFFGYRYLGPFGSAQINSIAVMPFVNESGNADVEYLSDGMTETLISSLSQIPNLNVKARSSVFRYKGKETSAQNIGKELGVQAILIGRVVQRGQDLTLYVELVDAATENSLWKQSYHKTMTNLVALQNDIARDVADKLKVKLSGTDEQRLAKNHTANAEAYQLYLEGRFYVNKRTSRDLRIAIERFSGAIAVDPNYALAFAGLSDAYSLLTNYLARSPGEVTAKAHEVMPKAREAALKALSLDPELAEGHTALGYVVVQYDYDFAGGEREYRRAIELDPNYATAHQWLGEMLVSLGRFEEGFAELRRAVEIEPFSLAVNFSYGIKLFQARRYTEAIAQLKKALELDNSFQGTLSVLAWAYEANGNYAEAVETTARSFELRGEGQRGAAIRDQFAKSGWPGVLKARNESEMPDNQGPYMLAGFYAQKGEKDKAFAELEKAYESRTFLIGSLKVDWRFDPLRDDPRFKDLLKKIGFPE